MSETTITDEAGGPFSNETGLPRKLSELRQKLYRKAKTEPKFRFYALWDRIHRPDVLRAAFGKVASNDGGPGVDGLRVDDVKHAKGGVEAFLGEIHEALKTKTYRSEAVKRSYILKPDGRKRPLGIPTIRDRVVQTAAQLILEPIFEADFQECSYGFRPERGAHDAICAIIAALRQGRTAVLDADLKSYFDTIPHDKLMKCVERRIADRAVLSLIRMWLKAPIEELPESPGGKPRRHRPTRGTPQGGVISPLLANLYLHWLDVPFHRMDGPGSFAGARLVRYADDFVILARFVDGPIEAWIRRWIEDRMGLTLNMEKTRILRVTPHGDRLDFLGFALQWRKARRGDWHYLHTSPSPTSLKRSFARIKELTAPKWGLLPIGVVIERLNAYLRGWTNYFQFGQARQAFSKVAAYARHRVYRHLRRRSQRPYRLPPDRTWYQHLHADLGLLRPRVAAARSKAVR